jgi:hypothetical protein
MATRVWFLELLGVNEDVMLRFRIREVESSGNGHNGTQSKTQSENGANKNPSTQSDLMTEAQKKYLFRIYADKGIEGDDAYDQIKKLFGVDNLGEITKFDASKAIDRLVKAPKGGNGNGSYIK